MVYWLVHMGVRNWVRLLGKLLRIFRVVSNFILLIKATWYTFLICAWNTGMRSTEILLLVTFPPGHMVGRKGRFDLADAPILSVCRNRTYLPGIIHCFRVSARCFESPVRGRNKQYKWTTWDKWTGDLGFDSQGDTSWIHARVIFLFFLGPWGSSRRTYFQPSLNPKYALDLTPN